MTFTTPSTSRDDFPYFETHNFYGWARQFRTMADSVDNGCSIAFDPMSEPPTDEEETPIPQTPADTECLKLGDFDGPLLRHPPSRYPTITHSCVGCIPLQHLEPRRLGKGRV